MDSELKDEKTDGSETGAPAAVATGGLPSSLCLVGIGASAGGLEAIRELVKNLPLGIPAAYVIVQHMSPDHKSMLTALIARETTLPVFDVISGTRPEPNVIYVTPPNRDIVLKDGLLELEVPRTDHAAPKPSIDRFFDSAASSFGERSVGIVLSGTGSDGSNGIRADPCRRRHHHRPGRQDCQV